MYIYIYIYIYIERERDVMCMHVCVCLNDNQAPDSEALELLKSKTRRSAEASQDPRPGLSQGDPRSAGRGAGQPKATGGCRAALRHPQRLGDRARPPFRAQRSRLQTQS